MVSYIEIKAVTETDYEDTGFCEEYKTFSEALRFFNLRERHKVGPKKALYVMDLYRGTVDLVDSMPLDERGFEAITRSNLGTAEPQPAVDVPGLTDLTDCG